MKKSVLRLKSLRQHLHENPILSLFLAAIPVRSPPQGSPPPFLHPASTIKLLTFKKAFHALYPLKIEQTAAVRAAQWRREGGRRAARPFYPYCPLCSVRPWAVVVEERHAGGQVRHRREGALAVGREVGDEGGRGLEQHHFLIRVRRRRLIQVLRLDNVFLPGLSRLA